MKSILNRHKKKYGRLNSANKAVSDVFEPAANSNAKQRAAVVEWLNSLLPNLYLRINASDEELRRRLIDGTVLCQILNRLRPGSVTECGDSGFSLRSRSENVQRFLEAMDKMGLPGFQVSDLEKGSMKIVLECLLTLKEHFMQNTEESNLPKTDAADKSENDASMRWKRLGQHFGGNTPGEVPSGEDPSTLSGEERRKGDSDSRFQRALRSPLRTEPSVALMHDVVQKFQQVFQPKQGSYADLSAAKISEIMKSNNLDNCPTQSLLSVLYGILNESIERKNGEIPYRVACLLRKVLQELERRISTQSEQLKSQNNLSKAREEKYQSRIRALEALATGTGDGTKTKMEEEKKLEEHDVVKLMEEKDHSTHEIFALKQELEIVTTNYEQQCLQMKKEAMAAQQELEERLKEVVNLLTESRNRVKQLEAFSNTKFKRWDKKEHIYQIFTDFQLGVLRELRFATLSIKQELLKTQKSYSEEFHLIETKISAKAEASEAYHALLAENRKMYNEIQDLKGNIRVYCRIRPFLPGQTEKQSTIEYIGENGELVVVNPSKHGKDGHRSFRFNKVYGPATTQERKGKKRLIRCAIRVLAADVFSDTQPLIRSVLDGYNVCVFAYGQTGSGKTYTMSGPDGASEEEWGINYRALNDLFNISETRSNLFTYEIGVQMVEIYNEQVRDLLLSDGAPKKLGISSTSQPSGLAVPDATMHPVKSSSDVLELMETGLRNRAKGATALNERSSRSHSIFSIHVCGTDLKTSASLRGSLHLVDLAGSERVDRTETTGDRIKEGQYINKSLSALGDVIFALAQKSPHVPYRNSKLTQVLQSSLGKGGGRAKTLMFVQINPDISSYSETISTLKFAERVSGVELGAAKSSKEGRDVTELMEQVASLKDTITKKDEEIVRLQMLKDLKNVYHSGISEKRASSFRH